MNVILHSFTHHVRFFAKESLLRIKDKKIALVALAIIALAICYAYCRHYLNKKNIVRLKEEEQDLKNDFEKEMKVLKIQDFPIQNLPVEIQSIIFSATQNPTRLASVCHAWKDIAEQQTYFNLLREIEHCIGEKQAQAIYLSKNLSNASNKEKLRCSFQNQKKRLNYILIDSKRAQACLKYLGTRRLDFASFQKCEQWIKDYHLLIMCRLAREHDILFSKAEIAISNLFWGNNFRIAETAEDLRRNFLNLPFQNIKNLHFGEAYYDTTPKYIGGVDDLRIDKLYPIIPLRFSEIPPEIGLFTQLEEIDLRSNKISVLPPEVCQLTKLKKLDLSYNQISSLPSEIGKLTQLQDIVLSNNKLDSLPSQIGEMVNLQWISLHNNNLTCLPTEFGKLVLLKVLNLNDNKISSLPPEISQLSELIRCGLNNNNLKSIPNEMAQLPQLKSIDLNRNPLEQWPIELQPLEGLQKTFRNW